MKRLFVFAVLFIVLTASCSAQVLDGNLWARLTDDGKMLVIMSMAQGEWIVEKILYDSGEAVVLESVDNFIHDTRTLGEAIRAIDTFYENNPDKLDALVCVVYWSQLKQLRKGE